MAIKVGYNYTIQSHKKIVEIILVKYYISEEENKTI